MTTTTWLTTVTSVAIPEPIRNRLATGQITTTDNETKNLKDKDTIECDVTVHKEMN